MKVSKVTQVAIQSEPEVAGWGFSIGERFAITLTFRTIEEANVARRAVLKVLSDAVETTERWSPAKR